MNITKIKDQLRDELRNQGFEALADGMWLNVPNNLSNVFKTASKGKGLQSVFGFGGMDYLLVITDNHCDDLPKPDDYWACLYQGDMSESPIASVDNNH